MTDEKKIYKVSELNRLIRRTLENSFGSIWLEGELSNVRRPSSGHYYLTIKDASSQISGVLFRGNQRNVKFEPADGMKVRVSGDISVYEPSGTYQIIIRGMEEAGKGALQEQFEKLKQKLLQEGLFASERKVPLPLLPQHVGIVTSRTGAAVRDILNVVNRRFPNLHIVLAPVRVQGEGAAAEIAGAIDMLNQRGGLDVMIVGRGGGSLEDLWCFNEEIVARAIARSKIPVISAVGHEIDYTISDFVSDLRAPTPSAAAELVVGCKDAFEDDLRRHGAALNRALREMILAMRNRLLAVSGSQIFSEPRNMVKQYLQQVDSLAMRMQHSLEMSVNEQRRSLQSLSQQLKALSPAVISRQYIQRMESLLMRMNHALRISTQGQAQDLQRLSEKLMALSPKSVLSRGYSVTMDESGKAIQKVSTLEKGQRVVTLLEDGSFEAEVDKILSDG